jgi:hypothetical protein
MKLNRSLIPHTDLCNMCADKCIVFPSLEAFEEGIKLPATYVIFYDYFVKSSVGDAAWKESCLHAKDPSDPIVTPQEEAFALILLKNNYFAWLWEAKSALGANLVTDYDTPEIRRDVGEISDVFLKCQIDLDHVPEENDSNWNNCVLVKPNVNPRKYEALRKATNARLKQVRLKASGSDKYKQLNDALIEEQACEVSENTPPVLLDQTRCKKKRKVLKTFREYTNPKDSEGKFKGWSTRAATHMRDAIQILKIVDKKDLLFRRIYRHIYMEEKGGAKKQKRVQEQECPDNYEEDMWGLTAEVTPV